MSFNKDFAARLAIGIFGGLFFLCIVWYRSAMLAFVLVFFSLFALYEYFALVTGGGHRPFRLIGYLISIGFLYIAYKPPSGQFSDLHVAFALCIGTLVLLKGLQMTGRLPERKITGLLITVFGGFYIGGSISCVIGLHHIQQMRFHETFYGHDTLFLLPFVGAWASDTGAYLSGRLVGREQLTRISPNKTIEGFVGSVFAGFVAVYAFGYYFLGLALPALMLLGLTIPFFGLGGDLFESAIKRRFNAKDSGAFFRNHGGVLDRFDSIFFVAPLTYFIIYYFYIYL
jgi:phosphatidate cytidylyltransferase